MKTIKRLTPFILFMVLINSCDSMNNKNTVDEGDFSNQLTQEEIHNARLSPEILWKFGRLSDMQLSPDGIAIIYSLTRYDAKTNKKHSWIYKIPSGGGEPVNLTPELPSCSNPRWINNSLVSFLCKENDVYKIWQMTANGENKKAISEIKGNINSFEFAPDGNTLFYLQDVKLDSSVSDKYPDLPLASGIVAEDLMYRHWDSWHDYTYSHIFITSLKKGKIEAGKDIMEGEKFDSPLPPYFDISDIAWSPDAGKLAYSCKKTSGRKFAESTNTDIYIYDVKNKSTRNITEGMEGYDRFPVFSPDGKKVAFMSMETPGYEADKERLFIYDLDNQNNEYITKDIDQNASNFVWTSDSKKLLFISGIKATYQIFELGIDTLTLKQITRGNHDYTAITLKNGVLAGTRCSLLEAPEIFTIEQNSGAEKQITFTNKNIYDAVAPAIIEERWVKTTDGKDMLVWLVLPPDFDPKKKYPALLYCQGGPQSAVSQRFSFRWNLPLMAAHGYVIIAPNRRGLPTFGQEWNEQISGDYGGQNIRDYLSAVDEISKEPYIDKNRMGAVGASYGGYSVLFLAGCHEKRFKAFISHCGMFNLESQSAATEEMFFVHHDLGGYYWDRPKPVSFTKFSPHLYVDKWDTPIMLVTGMNDFRIPYTESLQAFNVAQLRGIPSKLLAFPDENHWVLKPQNSLLWQREFFGWLDKWLK